jgi:hypothetical protein
MRGYLFAFLLLMLQLGYGQSDGKSASVLINAADGKGKPEILTANDLRVEVDGKRAIVTKVESLRELPITFALVLDVSGSMRDKVPFIKEGASAIFDLASVNHGQGLLVVTGERIGVSKGFISREQLSDLLSKLEIKSGGGSFTAGIRAACDALEKLESDKPTHRAILVITDGQLPKDELSTAQETVRKAVHARAPVIVLGLVDSREGRKNLELITQTTGGAGVLLEMPSKFTDKIQQYLQSGYRITFELPDMTSGFVPLRVWAETQTKNKIRITAPIEFQRP